MKYKISKLLPFLLCISLLTGCGTSKKTEVDTKDPVTPISTEKPVTPGDGEQTEITIGMQNPLTLNPIYNMDRSVEQNLYLIFDTLVNIEEDGSISPNLAKSWSYNQDQKVAIVELRNDVKWHDGKPFTSKDVVFTLDTIQKAPESPYKLTVQNIANVQVVDEYTVKIYYRQNFSGIYQTLFFPVIPEHIYHVDKEQQVEVDPIGTGPYRYVASTTYKNMTLEANENYFLGAPSIKKINMMIIPDEESLLYAFEQGLIDVIYTDVLDWGKYAKDKSASIYEIGTSCYEFMGLNFNKPIFQNENIRQMLVYALDRQEITDVYFLGHAKITDTPIAPHSYLNDPTLEVKAYDVEKAKLLLVGEGYTVDPDTKLFTKNNIPLSFNLLVNGDNAERVRVAEGIRKMYKEIGVQVILDQVDAATYKERIYNKQFEAFLGGWKLSYIPDLTFAFHSSQIASGDNFVSYKDQVMDDLLNKTFSTHPDLIKDAYSSLQQYMTQKNPYISLYFKNGALITNKKIGGNIQPTPVNYYANVEEWQIVD